jgi:iron-sulfur cluster repair protein YtfE (RIC family)
LDGPRPTAPAASGLGLAAAASMNATELLEQQHAQVKELLSKIADGDAEFLSDLADNLAAHMTIEQEMFYPAARRHAESRVLESFEQHSLAEVALKRLLELDDEDEAFDARLRVLKELIEQHVAEEEQQLFPAVLEAMPAAELESLGKQMQARFAEAVKRGYEALLPEGCDVTSADLATDVGVANGDAFDDEGSDDEITRRQTS